ncbi:translation initiation factor IF-2-like [Serinus canaria]|uniref:translation initiation factor IF-2-like n=1 Tax=Serinus canaria TaxID=9135 RepID=UPI0021CC76A3|nr:translation initiation factor IF-2-like [Serinus canaria]
MPFRNVAGGLSSDRTPDRSQDLRGPLGRAEPDSRPAGFLCQGKNVFLFPARLALQNSFARLNSSSRRRAPPPAPAAPAGLRPRRNPARGRLPGRGGRTPILRSALAERRRRQSGSTAAPRRSRGRGRGAQPPSSSVWSSLPSAITNSAPTRLFPPASQASFLPALHRFSPASRPPRRAAGSRAARDGGGGGGGRPASGPDWRSRRTWGRPHASALAARPPPRGTARHGRAGERTGLRSARVSAHRTRRCGGEGRERSPAEPAESYSELTVRGAKNDSTAYEVLAASHIIGLQTFLNSDDCLLVARMEQEPFLTRAPVCYTCDLQ